MQTNKDKCMAKRVYIVDLSHEEKAYGIYESTEYSFVFNQNNFEYYEAIANKIIFEVDNSGYERSNRLVDIRDDQMFDRLDEAIKDFIKWLFSENQG